MIRSLVYVIGLGFLFSHELDAVTQHEWRLLYVLRGLEDESGRDAFVLLHVPLFAALIGLSFASRPLLRAWSRLLLAAFMVVHVGLHWRLSGHPLYSFHDEISNTLIAGAGLCGLTYTLMTLMYSRRELLR